MFETVFPGKKPPFQGSKWLQLHTLLDVAEFENLLNFIGEIYIVPMGKIVDSADFEISPSTFLEIYSAYISALKEGRSPTISEREALNVAISDSKEDFYALSVDSKRFMPKFSGPVILVSEHTLDYSTDEKKFRSMIRGPSTIAWGVELKYPSLYMDPVSKEIVNTLKSGTALYKKVQSWMRKNSAPTRFFVEEQSVVSTARIGVQAAKWVHSHPDLLKRGIGIV